MDVPVGQRIRELRRAKRIRQNIPGKTTRIGSPIRFFFMANAALAWFERSVMNREYTWETFSESEPPPPRTSTQ